MKLVLGFDTSALVSLGHTDLFEFIVENYNIVVTESILRELEEIARFEDEDGNAAQKWLQRSSKLDLRETEKKRFGEDEVFEICKNEDIPVVTDDIRAIKRFEDKIDCFFSVHVVYLLYKRGLISKERAILSVEKMRTERDWRTNLISVTAKILFD